MTRITLSVHSVICMSSVYYFKWRNGYNNCISLLTKPILGWNLLNCSFLLFCFSALLRCFWHMVCLRNSNRAGFTRQGAISIFRFAQKYW